LLGTNLEASDWCIATFEIWAPPWTILLWSDLKLNKMTYQQIHHKMHDTSQRNKVLLVTNLKISWCCVSKSRGSMSILVKKWCNNGGWNGGLYSLITPSVRGSNRWWKHSSYRFMLGSDGENQFHFHCWFMIGTSCNNSQFHYWFQLPPCPTT